MPQYLDRNVPRQLGVKWTGDFDHQWDARNADRWLTRHTQVFAIGSCFALNFTRWLVEQGLPLTIPPWGMHYNPATILNELLSSSGRKSHRVVWTVEDENGRSRYIDAMRHTIISKTPGELNILQDRIELASREMYRTADAFLVTLGLSEIWESTDGRDGIVINRAPYISGETQLGFRNRFLRVDEVVQYIRQIVDVIRSDKGDSVPIVFTVSPVPLKTTSSGCDPQMANIRSKAILLSAIHEFLDEDTATRPASYFPSYEIFLGAPRKSELWQADLRHPSAYAIDYVCRHFVECYRYGDFVLSQNVTFTVPEVA